MPVDKDDGGDASENSLWAARREPKRTDRVAYRLLHCTCAARDQLLKATSEFVLFRPSLGCKDEAESLATFALPKARGTSTASRPLVFKKTENLGAAIATMKSVREEIQGSVGPEKHFATMHRKKPAAPHQH